MKTTRKMTKAEVTNIFVEHIRLPQENVLKIVAGTGVISMLWVKSTCAELEAITGRNLNKILKVKGWGNDLSKLTIAQIIEAFSGRPTRQEILAFFVRETAPSRSLEEVAAIEIGKQTIDRATQIELVECLEYATAKELLADNDHPMRYMPEKTTLGEIADAFSSSDSQLRILYKKILRSPEKTQEEQSQIYRAVGAAVVQAVPSEESLQAFKAMAKAYLEISTGPVEDDTLLTTLEVKDLSGCQWDQAIIFMEDDLMAKYCGYVLLPDYLKWNKDGKKTVKDLLDVAVERYLVWAEKAK